MAQRARALASLTAILLAVGIGACGGGDGGDDRDAVRETVTRFVDANNKGDFAAVCDLLAESETRSITRQGGGGGCAKALGRISAGTTQTQVRIDEVRVNADRASVDATFIAADSGAPSPQTLRLVEEDGDWKIASVGG